MKSTVSFSAQADSFQLTINWKAIATIVSTLARKSLTIVTSEKFALAIAGLSAVASYFYLATDHPLRFVIAIIVACFALARVIVPMTKGGAA